MVIRISNIIFYTSTEATTTGFVPPARGPEARLDEETRRLVLMTPEDYTFPVPTRVTDITGRRLDEPEGRSTEDPRRATEGQPRSSVGLPHAPSPVSQAMAATAQTSSRLWDAWDMHTRGRPQQTTSAPPATGLEPRQELPVGERPADFRADPFLTCRVEAALTRNVSSNEPASGRNKSGLTRTAQDAARVEITWPHHRVWLGISPVTYGNLNPWEFVFGYLAIVREMEQSEYVLSTMLCTLYNFALVGTKHDWSFMREAFQIVLLEIEEGNLSWANVGPINLVLKQAIIDIVARPAEDKDGKAQQQNKSEGMGQSMQKRKQRTCSKYQKGLCTENQNHYLGRWLYHHACAICLKATLELVNHPTRRGMIWRLEGKPGVTQYGNGEKVRGMEN